MICSCKVYEVQYSSDLLNFLYYLLQQFFPLILAPDPLLWCPTRCRMEWLCTPRSGLSSPSSTWRCSCSTRPVQPDVTVPSCRCCCCCWRCWPGEAPKASTAPFPNPEMRHQLKALSLFPLTLRFLLENFCLDEHVRYILIIYPVVITCLAGVLSNSDISDSEVFIFAGIAPLHVPVTTQIINLFSPSSASILAISSVLFVFRVVLVTWRHYKRPLYKDCNMSPVEIALTQRNIFS